MSSTLIERKNKSCLQIPVFVCGGASIASSIRESVEVLYQQRDKSSRMDADKGSTFSGGMGLLFHSNEMGRSRLKPQRGPH